MTTTTTAFEAARDAHENDFESHRGARTSEDDVILYDNHPWRGRALEHAMLRQWLAGHGYEWTEGHYPTEGESTGYTVAFVVAFVDEDTMTPILDAWRSALHVTLAMAADGTLTQATTNAMRGGSS